MTDVLVIRPEGDETERTLSVWVDMLLPPGTGLPGITVVDDLQGAARATAPAVQARCPNGDIVLYFGHGAQASLGDPVLLDTATISAANRRIVIAIACESSHTLGPAAVNNQGVTEYFGFSEPLFVYIRMPALFGAELTKHLRAYLTGTSSLHQVASDVVSDFQGLEALYRTGPDSKDLDALMIWMGARMNWRGTSVQ
jgi:hypothetical protein